MATDRQIGVGIILMTAIGAATGLAIGILSLAPGVGVAATGIILGTAVSRGALSAKLGIKKKN